MCPFNLRVIVFLHNLHWAQTNTLYQISLPQLATVRALLNFDGDVLTLYSFFCSFA